MKVIDLLNKIANGEEVKFIYEDNRFSTSPGLSIHNDTCGNWISIEINSDTHKSLDYSFLKNEVEIIEDKKIEKLKSIEQDYFTQAPDNFDLMNKINEIIDYLEENK